MVALTSLRSLLIVFGLSCISVGLPIVGNAMFAQEPAIFWSSAQLQYNGTAQLRYYTFLKPTDRFTITLTSTSNSTNYIMHIIHVSNHALVSQSNQTESISFMQQFAPKERGIYLLDIYISVDKNVSFGISQSYTIIGGRPTDLLSFGEAISLSGVFLLFMSYSLSSSKLIREKNTKRFGPIHTWPRFLTLLIWELFSTKKILFSFPIFFAIMYSGAAFVPSSIIAGSSVSKTPVWNIINPSNMPTKDWIILFPIMVALAAYTFSYEKDNLVIRSIMLNPVSAKNVFAAKLVSMIIIFLIPAASAFALILFLFDPVLFTTSVLAVWHNLWIWITLYFLFGFLMIAYSILPAVVLRKAVYAFVIPIFVSFLFETENFGVQSYLPSNVWLTHATGQLTATAGSFDWSNFLGAAAPSIFLGILLLLFAFIIFTLGNRE